jgi:hypothetical protein
LAANSDGRYFRGAGSSSTNGWADPGVNLWSCGKTGRQGGLKQHTVAFTAALGLPQKTLLNEPERYPPELGTELPNLIAAFARIDRLPLV